MSQVTATNSGSVDADTRLQAPDFPQEVLQQPQQQNSSIPWPRLADNHRRLRNPASRPHPADLPQDKQECPVCDLRYGASQPSGAWEWPIELECGHIYGNLCFDEWLQRNNTCPFCRAQLNVIGHDGQELKATNEGEQWEGEWWLDPEGALRQTQEREAQEMRELEELQRREHEAERQPAELTAEEMAHLEALERQLNEPATIDLTAEQLAELEEIQRQFNAPSEANAEISVEERAVLEQIERELNAPAELTAEEMVNLQELERQLNDSAPPTTRASEMTPEELAEIESLQREEWMKDLEI